MDGIDGRLEWSWREIIKQLEKGKGLFMRSENMRGGGSAPNRCSNTGRAEPELTRSSILLSAATISLKKSAYPEGHFRKHTHNCWSTWCCFGRWNRRTYCLLYPSLFVTVRIQGKTETCMQTFSLWEKKTSFSHLFSILIFFFSILPFGVCSHTPFIWCCFLNGIHRAETNQLELRERGGVAGVWTVIRWITQVPLVESKLISHSKFWHQMKWK